MNDHQRNYQLVLVGATGFTGRLVAAYLNECSALTRWAIAGRNKAKLESIRLTHAPNAEILVADSTSERDMRELAQQSSVVLSTAGPFAQIGTLLVEACAKSGTDYCDITGETQWIRHTIDEYHDLAEKNGARIIHCCGFDSIPSDMGVFLLRKNLPEDKGPLHSLGVMTRLRGQLSGGTYASMQNVMAAAKNREIARILAHPFGLNPKPIPKTRDPKDQRSATYQPALKMWTSPFIMSSINTRVVRRSEALRGFACDDLRYDETMRSKSALQARTRTLALGLGVLSQTLAPFRALSRLFLPKQGEGPSELERQSGHFEMKVFGGQANHEHFSHMVRVWADSDPGYSATAKMLAESGLACLVHPKDKTGVLTPSTALGDVLLDRLNQAGIYFESTSL